jgi:fructokinase
MLHPEAGHILLQGKKGDTFEGICPYHKNCFEGLASGPAIKARYGAEPYELLGKRQVWELEADYIGKALMQYICCYSPRKIILGGGVMHVKELFPMIREKTLEYLSGYIASEELERIWDKYYTNRQRNGKGVSGLGLAIVKQIVIQHGGVCGAESEIGKGSVFRITLNMTLIG